MTGYVALVRAVNVGGHNRLPMARFRDLLGSLGYSAVATHLQSGNAVFTGPRGPTGPIERGIEKAIAAQVGPEVKVMVRTRAELAAVVAANPLPEAVHEPARLLVAFLSADPGPERVAAIDMARFQPDQLRAGDRVLYLWYRNGVGRSKLTNVVLERSLGVAATARNWGTVTALLDLVTAAG